MQLTDRTVPCKHTQEHPRQKQWSHKTPRIDVHNRNVRVRKNVFGSVFFCLINIPHRCSHQKCPNQKKKIGLVFSNIYIYIYISTLLRKKYHLHAVNWFNEQSENIQREKLYRKWAMTKSKKNTHIIQGLQI